MLHHELIRNYWGIFFFVLAQSAWAVDYADYIAEEE